VSLGRAKHKGGIRQLAQAERQAQVLVAPYDAPATQRVPRLEC
jgi:hypothetical protein